MNTFTKNLRLVSLEQKYFQISIKASEETWATPDTFKLVYQTFNSWTKLLCVIVEERNIQKSVIILQPNGKNRHKFNIFWWLASYFCNNNLFEVAYFGALFTDCEYRNPFLSILWHILCSCNASTWSEQRDMWRRFF